MAQSNFGFVGAMGARAGVDELTNIVQSQIAAQQAQQAALAKAQQQQLENDLATRKVQVEEGNLGVTRDKFGAEQADKLKAIQDAKDLNDKIDAAIADFQADPTNIAKRANLIRLSKINPNEAIPPTPAEKSPVDVTTTGPDGKPLHVFVTPTPGMSIPGYQAPKDTSEQDLTRSLAGAKDATSQIDALRKPVDDMAGKIGDLKDIVNQGTGVADAVIAPKLLSVIAGGQGSGVRVTKSEINQVMGGRSLPGGVEAFLTKVAKGESVTPTQRQQMLDLAGLYERKLGDRIKTIRQAQSDVDAAKDIGTQRSIVNKLKSDMEDISLGVGGSAAPSAAPVNPADPLGIRKGGG